MSVNAHAALLSQFAKAGGFFDRLVETCPMRLTSNNAPEVRDLIETVMVSMVNIRLSRSDQVACRISPLYLVISRQLPQVHPHAQRSHPATQRHLVLNH